MSVEGIVPHRQMYVEIAGDHPDPTEASDVSDVWWAGSDRTEPNGTPLTPHHARRDTPPLSRSTTSCSGVTPKPRTPEPTPSPPPTTSATPPGRSTPPRT